jgi:hypothetical protein
MDASHATGSSRMSAESGTCAGWVQSVETPPFEDAVQAVDSTWFLEVVAWKHTAAGGVSEDQETT